MRNLKPVNDFPRLALRSVAATAVLGCVLSLTGCDDPQIYGSVGISSGYGGYGGYYGGYHGGYGGWGRPRMRSSISVGGRIR